MNTFEDLKELSIHDNSIRCIVDLHELGGIPKEQVLVQGIAHLAGVNDNLMKQIIFFNQIMSLEQKQLFDKAFQ